MQALVNLVVTCREARTRDRREVGLRRAPLAITLTRTLRTLSVMAIMASLRSSRSSLQSVAMTELDLSIQPACAMISDSSSTDD